MRVLIVDEDKLLSRDSVITMSIDGKEVDLDFVSYRRQEYRAAYSGASEDRRELELEVLFSGSSK